MERCNGRITITPAKSACAIRSEDVIRPRRTFDKVELMPFPAFIEARADVMLGKPCFKGTRIPVYLILEKLAAGETSEVILAAYPQLKPEHIKASLEYAARLAADEIVVATQ
jgi:uncharacterized protein (DUF433 family)